MPTYEYRCESCRGVSEITTTIADRPATVQCDHCKGNAKRIISRSAVRLSSASKVDRLDPKYDRMVDNAMNSNPLSDPDRLLKKMRPFSDAND